MQPDILVSVVCLAFNHEKYIRKALEGFVSQKTSFPYEVIVHDDASSDNTASIIREFEAKYPSIIKPVYQTENQYSKKIGIGKTFIVPRVRGAYVAICEGDDYWTDPYKLQKQFDAMEANPNCSLCTHKVLEVYEDCTENGVVFPSRPIETGVLPSHQFFDICREYSFHTSSYFLRSAYYRGCLLDPPEFVQKSDVGDESFMMYLGSHGDVFYINDAMSCYRRGVIGSWSSGQRQSLEKTIRHCKCMVEAFQSFDQYSSYKYHEIFADRIARSLTISAILEKKSYTLLKKENREYFRRLSPVKKAFILLSVVFPRTMRAVYLKRLGLLSQKRGVR